MHRTFATSTPHYLAHSIRLDFFSVAAVVAGYVCDQAVPLLASTSISVAPPSHVPCLKCRDQHLGLLLSPSQELLTKVQER